MDTTASDTRFIETTEVAVQGYPLALESPETVRVCTSTCDPALKETTPDVYFNTRTTRVGPVTFMLPWRCTLTLQLEGRGREEDVRWADEVAGLELVEDVAEEVLSLNGTFKPPLMYLLAATMQLPAQFARCYTAGESPSLRCALDDVLATQREVRTLKVLMNDKHWALLVLRLEDEPRVVVVSSTNQAANMPLEEIQADHFRMIGAELNKALQAHGHQPISACDVGYAQFLQYGNMSCGFLTVLAEHRVLQGEYDFEARLVRPGDRVEEETGRDAMLLELATGNVVTRFLAHDEDVSMSDEYELLGIGPHREVTHFEDRSERSNRVLEALVRMAFYMVLARRRAVLLRL